MSHHIGDFVWIWPVFSTHLTPYLRVQVFILDLGDQVCKEDAVFMDQKWYTDGYELFGTEGS